MINTFDELLAHAGHETETVYYGTENQAVNVSIKCITCGCVLVDLSPGDLLSKELAEDTISKDGTEITIKWSIEDVIQQAEEDDINLSEQQAKEILANINHHHDAEIGINWIVISSHIDMYLNEMSGNEKTND